MKRQLTAPASANRTRGFAPFGGADAAGASAPARPAAACRGIPLGAVPDWLRSGQTLRLDLLEHQDITVAVEAVEPPATGGFIVQGRATSDEASTVVLTLEAASLTGFIRLTGLGQFRIAPGAGGEEIEVQKIASRPPGFCGPGLFCEGRSESAAGGTL
ncbi:MAG: hypothetical protein KIT22_01235 [Verrucomicrobiae bacterium]|nr:hypothetical protein [Verrucomicrobiae bacterium]